MRHIRLAVIAALSLGCGANSGGNTGPGFYSPLTSSVWAVQVPRPHPRWFSSGASGTDSDKTTEPSGETGDAKAETRARDVRSLMVQAAGSWLEEKTSKDDFGASDTTRIVSAVLPPSKTGDPADLRSLVDEAKTAGAYFADADVERGDIVVFHNLGDLNGNGESDDWMTGCGIALKTRGPRFDAVLRTGHEPRLVSAWPDGPSVREVEGRVVNSYVRVPCPSDPPGTAYLAGQLYAGRIDVEALARYREK